jgi:hypothetical protein
MFNQLAHAEFSSPGKETGRRAKRKRKKSTVFDGHGKIASPLRPRQQEGNR